MQKWAKQPKETQSNYKDTLNDHKDTQNNYKKTQNDHKDTQEAKNYYR